MSHLAKLTALLLAAAALQIVSAQVFKVPEAHINGIPVEYASDDVPVADLEKRQQVLVKNPIIFGLDLLGWGTNARTTPEEGITMRLYKWAFTEGNEYQYPLEPETVFRVPDEVYVRTVAEQIGSAYYYINTYQYLEALNIAFGIGIQGSSKKDTPSNGGTAEPVNSADIENTDLSSFSGNIGITYRTRQMDTNEFYIFENALEVGLWQIVLGPALEVSQTIKDSIASTIAAADAASGSSAKDLAYYEFLDRHGTHYVESVVVGGRLKLTSTTSKKLSLDVTQIGFYANAQFNNMFGLDSGYVNFTIDYTEVFQNFTRETTNDMDVKGGDPDLANFFGGPDVDAAALFVDWQKSLIANPAVIRMRLRDICWLFGSNRVECQKRNRDYIHFNAEL